MAIKLSKDGYMIPRICKCIAFYGKGWSWDGKIILMGRHTVIAKPLWIRGDRRSRARSGDILRHELRIRARDPKMPWFWLWTWMSILGGWKFKWPLEGRKDKETHHPLKSPGEMRFHSSILDSVTVDNKPKSLLSTKYIVSETKNKHRFDNECRGTIITDT